MENRGSKTEREKESGKPASDQGAETYYRIGTQYYKVIDQPLISGGTTMKLVPWNMESIRQDHGKNFLTRVPRLDGFCLLPGHIHYRRTVGRFYNRYHPFEHEPKSGQYPSLTLAFVNHIFGSQLELGLDYLKLLLLEPVQQLPVLCLVSEERATGKSTFLNWLKAIFGHNMTINSNENFQSAFNSDWVTKLLIAVEEALLNKKEDSERFKNLSTAKYSKLESKGVDRQEIEFFGKFILCSNNEDNFIYIDRQEVRYWVRKIPAIAHNDTEILEKLTAEIPYFLAFLIERPYTTEKKTRMWFTPKQIATPALARLKAANQNRLEYELAQVIISILDNMDNGEGDACFCLGEVQSWLRLKGLRSTDAMQIKRLLQNGWQLKPAANSMAYTKWSFSADGTLYHSAAKGRFYTVSKKVLQSLHFFDDFDADAINK